MPAPAEPKLASAESIDCSLFQSFLSIGVIPGSDKKKKKFHCGECAVGLRCYNMALLVHWCNGHYFVISFL
jgi:hypothetical protein